MLGGGRGAKAVDNQLPAVLYLAYKYGDNAATAHTALAISSKSEAGEAGTRKRDRER